MGNMPWSARPRVPRGARASATDANIRENASEEEGDRSGFGGTLFWACDSLCTGRSAAQDRVLQLMLQLYRLSCAQEQCAFQAASWPTKLHGTPRWALAAGGVTCSWRVVQAMRQCDAMTAPEIWVLTVRQSARLPGSAPRSSLERWV